MNSFRIQVPASSANLGPGFDSVGLAVNLYLTLEVTKQDKWEFISPVTADDAPYEEHFIYKVAKQTADKYDAALPPCRVEETSSIPLARGLGSSAAAIIAGIEIANQLGKLNLAPDEKLRIATAIEGHPDNVAPALFGGLIISTFVDGDIDWLKINQLDIEFVVFIPQVELKTSDARDVLPEEYSNTEAALASGISNLAFAALVNGDYALAGQMMEKDRFHEPYRKKLIPNYNRIREEAKKLGAYGTVISGAGPTMIALVPSGAGQDLRQHMERMLPSYRLEFLKVDEDGLKVRPC